MCFTVCPLAGGACCHSDGPTVGAGERLAPSVLSGRLQHHGGHVCFLPDKNKHINSEIKRSPVRCFQTVPEEQEAVGPEEFRLHAAFLINC